MMSPEQSGRERIFICERAVDLRKSFDGLSGVVEGIMGEDPEAGDLFVFFNRTRTYANTAESEAAPIKSHYEVLLKYLGWTDAGQIIASGVWPVGAIKSTKYPDQAYQLGKSIKKKV